VAHAEINRRMLYRLVLLLGSEDAARRGDVIVLRTMRVGTSLTTQIVLKIDEIAGNMRHGGTADDTELGSALAAMLIFNGVDNVLKRGDALHESLLVFALVVAKSVVTHFIIRSIIFLRTFIPLYSMLYANRAWIRLFVTKRRVSFSFHMSNSK
jgi:hypothetical protein